MMIAIIKALIIANFALPDKRVRSRNRSGELPLRVLSSFMAHLLALQIHSEMVQLSRQTRTHTHACHK